jgi:EpsI family protein
VALSRDAARRALYGLLLALAAIAWHGLATWDPRSHGYAPVVGWFFETSDSSPQVVFAIVALLLFRRRAALRDALGRATSPALAALCVVPALGIHAWAQWVDAPDLSMVALALVLFGLAFLLGGRPLARLVAVPLAILVFAIPLPGALHNFVVYPYQLATARFTGLLLQAGGYEVMLQGDVLSLPGRDFEVIETCSGLRSALTLGLLAATWAAWFRCSGWHGTALLAASLPISFVTNGIRVLVLVLDPRPEVHESHVAQGLVMFVVGTGALSLVDRALLRLPAVRSAPSAEDAAAPARADHRLGLAAVALALLAMASATLALPALRPPPNEPPAPGELPEKLAGWVVHEGEFEGLFLGNVRFTQRSSRVYARADGAAAAFLGWDDRRLRIRSLRSEKNAIPGSGWDVEERGPAELEVGSISLRMERLVARRFADRWLAYHAYHSTGSVLAETLRALLALDQPGSPFAHTERARVLRISTPIGPGPEGLAQAEQRVRDLLADLVPVLVW